MRKASYFQDFHTSQNSRSAVTTCAAIISSAGRASRPAALLRLSTLMIKMMSLLFGVGIRILRWLAIPFTRGVTSCDTVKNRGEAFYPPFQLLSIVDEKSTADVLHRIIENSFVMWYIISEIITLWGIFRFFDQQNSELSLTTAYTALNISGFRTVLEFARHAHHPLQQSVETSTPSVHRSIPRFCSQPDLMIPVWDVADDLCSTREFLMAAVHWYSGVSYQHLCSSINKIALSLSCNSWA